MALHLLRSFVPEVQEEEAAAALARVLASRGCRVERAISHTAGALAELRAALSPGMRLLTQFSSATSGGPAAWILDETTAGLDLWDPLLAHELSAALGGFAVSAEASRSLGRHGYAVFFAGRTIEFTSNDSDCERLDVGDVPSGESTATLIERVYPAFTDLYTRLTGSPASSLLWEQDTRLTSAVASGSQREAVWRPRMENEPPLALAIFALAEEREFTVAWEELAAGRPATWRWHAAATSTSQISYVLLTRDGGLDMALFDALARRLDVPTAAVAMRAPGAPFAWWNAQPGEAPHHGQARGAAEFVQRLMPATVALGERPGVLRIRLE
ncbi:MAG: hypothetical protein ACRDTA_25515 [Pseudonocardiaceae bacterium]